MTLLLAGAGLGPGHFTRELIEALRRADMVYVEEYTMPSGLRLVEEVRRYTGRVVEASRGMLEEGAASIVEEASQGLVVVVTGGHPLIATTHVSLLALARSRGVEARVIHGVSGVVAAMTVAGLDFYKYGRIVTIPGPWRDVKPYSVAEYIYLNTAAGLHTMILLDIDEGGRQLCLGDAVETLLSVDRESVITGYKLLLVVNAGMEGERVEAIRAEPGLECHEGIASLIYPGGLSRIEAENIEAIHGIKLDPSIYQEARRIAARLLGSTI